MEGSDHNNPLQYLNEKIERSTSACFFNEPAEEMAISRLEKKHGFNFPNSFREFLKNWNGGFISLFAPKEGRDLDTLAWNSNNILALEIIDEIIAEFSYKTEGMDFCFIPFLHTAGGEYLGFLNPLEDGESKVYDLWHEASAWEWKEQVVYDTFHDLLNDYVERNGMIETIG